MTETVITALIAFFGSALSTFAGIMVNSRLTTYRLEQLEKKVDKHNNLVERMYNVESQNDLLEEKIKVANHRIDDLEKANK